jgi:hypothetical protein
MAARLSDIKMVEAQPSTFVPESDLDPASVGIPGTVIKTLPSGQRVFVAPPPPWKEFAGATPALVVGELPPDWASRTIKQVDVHGRVIAEIPIEATLTRPYVSSFVASLGPDAHIGAVCE